MTSGEGRIRRAFSGSAGPVLVAFTVAGDPDPDTCLAIMHAMVRGGAGVIELGLPWSDPVADGPVIQGAGIRALMAGMTPEGLFRLVRRFRDASFVPVVVLTYANPVLKRGVDRFYREAAAAGIDGLVIPDLPVEEVTPFAQAALTHGLAQVMMVSLLTPGERMERILSHAGGFVYLVSAMGVTGTRQGVRPKALAQLAEIRKRTRLPVAAGFGISTRAQVGEWAQAGADGVIVGSALVKVIGENAPSGGGTPTAVTGFLQGLVQDLPETRPISPDPAAARRSSDMPVGQFTDDGDRPAVVTTVVHRGLADEREIPQ